MNIKSTIFFEKQWRWTYFLKYLIFKLEKYNCTEQEVPSEFLCKNATYGSKKEYKKVNLSSWAASNKKINFARAVCINSQNYSVLNFLIIPKTEYNFPLFGLDFVSLQNYHLLVMDFQPSLEVVNQFDENFIHDILKIKKIYSSNIPPAKKMSGEIEKFFSPALIWSKLPIEESSNIIINNDLYSLFKKYLDFYLENLMQSKTTNEDLQHKIVSGQNNYLCYRKRKDPARPMLISLFGKTYTEELINEFLFKPN